MAGIRVLEEEHKVREIRTLGRPLDYDVRLLLEKVASQVQPIMRRRKWTVPTLSEFSPQNPALLGLNVNKGEEIKIRVRQPGRDLQLYQYEFVLGTMLHELAHIEHGPHDANFYKLLDELNRECDELIAKGVTGTGQGFDLPGRRLGGITHNPPPSNLRRVALAAAEKRRNIMAVMPSGPQKVGGDSGIKNLLSPVQAAAMAAERRARDDLWCGAPDTAAAQGEGAFQKAKEREETITVPPPTTPPPPAIPEVKGPSWECKQCTLRNPVSAVVCGACGARDATRSSWACKFCTLENAKGVERCAACGEWKYAIGSTSGSF